VLLREGKDSERIRVLCGEKLTHLIAVTVEILASETEGMEEL
jgi:hypothetical protein